MKSGDSEFENFTLPTLKTFLDARSQNVSGNKQSLVAHATECLKMHFFNELAIFWSAKKWCRHFFSTLHPLSPIMFAIATVLAFVLLHNFRFNFHWYTQHEATPTQKLAQKWCCNLSRLFAWKITKGIHSCKPASLNRLITMLVQHFEPQGRCLTNFHYYYYERQW